MYKTEDYYLSIISPLIIFDLYSITRSKLYGGNCYLTDIYFLYTRGIRTTKGITTYKNTRLSYGMSTFVERSGRLAISILTACDRIQGCMRRVVKKQTPQKTF